MPTSVDVGAGPTVVFLHSMAGSSDSWLAQMSPLSRDFRCVAWDMPGYGDSAPVPESTTLTQISGLLIDLLDHKGINEPVHLVGLSVGGMIAQRFALENPLRVASLVIMDSSASFGNGATSEAAAWSQETIQSIRATPHAGYCHAMVHAITADSTPDAVKATAVAAMGRSTVDGLCLAASLIAGHDAADELSTITAPTTVVVGDRDDETPVAYAQSISDSIPGARLVVVPESGHLSNIEAPDAVTAIVLEHLQMATS